MRTLRPHFLALVIALALILGAARPAPAATTRAVEPEGYLIKAIRHYRIATVRLRRVMGKPATLPAVRHVSLRRANAIWRHRAVGTQQRFLRGPAHKSAWLCIHRYEGAWSD